MFLQQNGLVDPMEVPLPIGLSWVTRLKTDILTKKKHKKIKIFTFAFFITHIQFIVIMR